MKGILTICICTNNNYSHCLKVVNSLLIQKNKNFKVIIQDNTIRNKKNSNQIKRVLELNKNYNYLYKECSGLSASRNICIDYCNTKYIHFLDDDVYCPPDFTENLLKILINKDISCIGGKVMPDWGGLKKPDWITPNCLMLMSMLNYGSEIIKYDTENLPNGRSPIFVGANICFKKRDLIDFGKFKENLGRISNSNCLLSNEENEILNKFYKNNLRVYYIPNIPVFHSVRENRLSIGWFIKRSAWQAVSDILSDNTSHYNVKEKESFAKSCITCIFSGLSSNIDDMLYKVQFLTYSLLNGLFKK